MSKEVSKVPMSVTMEQLADALRVLAGVPPLSATCATCGAPYRPDPRDVTRCAHCGDKKWKWGKK